MRILPPPAPRPGIPPREKPRGSEAKSINRFAADYDLSRSWVYELIAANKLQAVRIGCRYRITAEAERDFKSALQRGQLAAD